MSEPRTPPHSLEAERALIGAIWIEPETWDRVADLVRAEDFYLRQHQVIWEAITRLAAGDKPTDAVSVIEDLRRHQQIEDAGGATTLLEINEQAMSAASAPHYARQIRESSVLRQLVKTCTEIQDMALSRDKQALEVAASRFAEIGEQSQRGGPRAMSEAYREALDHIDRIFNSGNDLIGLPTGFLDLDKRHSGLQPGELVLVAGRPSMGKSTLAQNMADHAAMHQDKPVLFFSLEMSAKDLALRSLAASTGLALDQLRQAKLDDAGWTRLTSGVVKGKDSKVWIDEDSTVSVSDLTVRARRLHRQHGGLALIVVDYLQLIQGEGKSDSRNIEIMKISQGLKRLAKLMHCPVVALSQLNRGVEQRPNKRPMMSDLRDSGGLEQDADVILFVYRDEWYNPESPDKGTAEVITAKFRNGATGTDRLMFDGPRCCFRDLAPGWVPDEVDSRPGDPFEY